MTAQKNKKTRELYELKYKESIADPEKFWGKEGERISWIKKYTKVKDSSFNLDDLHISWYKDGTLNACYNTVDRHIENGHGNDIAIIWEKNSVNDDPNKDVKITFNQLKSEVSKFANVLKNLGVKKGDIVTLYMPMIPETIFAMLACARIGAVHSVCFSGFSSESLAKRIIDSDSKFIITADGAYRGNKTIELKKIVDDAIEFVETNFNTAKRKKIIQKVIVVGNINSTIMWNGNRDVWYNEISRFVSEECPLEEMHAEDPLFLLYTSGSTGTPKAVVHTTGGYLVYASITHEYVFNYKKGDIFWCTADIGWITGHTYLVYGPLTNGCTTLLFEGVPNYPSCSRIWEICDKYQVTTLYTSPTLLRMLKKEGDFFVTKTSRKSLRVLGSVGEPMQKDLWMWYKTVIGENRCDIVDTWWQTEGGGIMLSALSGFGQERAGSVSFPFFGINTYIVDQEGRSVPYGTEGSLVIKDSWPGQCRTIYKNYERFKAGYFSMFKNYFFSGDGAYTDLDGYTFITGRVDDIINVSGHRISTAGIESALNSNEKVAESAVVGFPHEIKGSGICAYVILKNQMDYSNIDELKNIKQELKNWVKQKNGATEVPDKIYIVDELPKTRTGKILRRILRKMTENPDAELGDMSTILNLDSVHQIKNILSM